MALDLAKFLARFVEEARDHVNRLNEGLVRLDQQPDDAETINAIFRSAHTIKGSARMMKLTPIAEVAHKLEDALGALREQKIGFSKELADLLFKGVDCIAAMVEKVAAGADPAGETGPLCEELARAAAGVLPAGAPAPSQEAPPGPAPAAVPEAASAPAGSQTAPPPKAAPSAPAGPAAPPPLKTERPEKKARVESIRVSADRLDELIRLMGEIVSHQNRLKRRLADIREVERTARKGRDLAAGLQAGGGGPEGRGAELASAAGELQAGLKQLAASMRDDANLQELLTAELQEKALMLRMVPLATVFDTFPRMVRDEARALGKEVALAVEGGEIGLDKKMIEKIGDPLVHMLRNAVDHGMEAPAVRREAGKPERGTIRLAACYDAGSVLIELSDDGGGIRLDKLKEKALQKKMHTEGELAAMTEPELLDLIFQPGFSTSPIITDLSGRGVGMDVVRRNIVEELKGSIKIETRPGKGTSFFIRLPMTLAVMRVLLIQTGGTTFAVTTHYVTEVLRVRTKEIIDVLAKKAIRLREELIPVADLDTLLGLPSRGGRRQDLLLLIVRVGGEKLGLIVEALLDEEDMVIKSLPAHMKNVSLVSGVTISGRNEVINILHVPELMRVAGDMKETMPERGRAAAARILVVDDSVNTREIEKSILEAYGYVVELAGDGQEALERTREARYDLVVTDVEMPRLDGFSLTERLRREEGYRETPIIIVTSREKEEDKRRGIQVGANAYIVKGSFDQTNLLETVQNLVG
ncbi:MAG: hybrid sensor histidine kinase/response regulator [Desulfobacteraceae bacterium]|nr:hybrid sensor histidine kinase/response regulator [Desulfobacteraceae bacterium]